MALKQVKAAGPARSSGKAMGFARASYVFFFGVEGLCCRVL